MAISQHLYNTFTPPPVRSRKRVYLASIPLVRQLTPASQLTWRAVGICERFASAALFAALSPVLAGSALAVSLLSGRTPLIAHRRVGFRGEPLWMLKLRTMWGQEQTGVRRRSRWVEYVEDHAGPERKQTGDPRVTSRFARFCRRHSIDELPQLWHVVRGEMSLVGPRPVTAEELHRYYGASAEELLQVRPGLAGLWQISGRNRLTYSERKQLDLDLVRNRTLRLYLKILLRTIPEVWSGTNAW